jgi:hypothetical protein
MYDSDLIACNQLAHEYHEYDNHNIIVDEKLFKTL